MVVYGDQVEEFLVDHMQVEENLVLVAGHTIGNQIQKPCIMVNLDLQILAVAVDVDGGYLDHTDAKVVLVVLVLSSLHILPK